MLEDERGQPAFGRYIKERRSKLGLSLRRVEALTDGRVRNAFLSQVENGQVGLPNVQLLADIAEIYGLDFWDMMWRAGYRIPERPPNLYHEDEGWTRRPLKQLEDLTDEELQEVLWYAEVIRQRRPRREGAKQDGDETRSSGR